MKLTQNWVGYLDRSYEQIKKSLLKRLSTKAPELSDHSESNPLIIIISMFAGIAEMLNLYIDSIAKEAYLGTARKYSSVVKLSRLIDYTIKARNPATVNLYFQILDGNGEPIVYPTGQLVIPKGSVILATLSNIPFVLLEDVIIREGSQNNYGTASQYTTVTDYALGNTNGVAGQIITISSQYVHNSMQLKVAGEDWFLYSSFAQMGPTTKGYIINIDEEANAFIQFGDGVNGKIPNNNSLLLGTYQETDGVLGNLPPDSLGTFESAPVLPSGYTIAVNNPDYASGGSNFQNVDEIKNLAPRSIRTLERAVTYQDYLDLALMVPGVGDAKLKYCCGKYVDIYICPNSPGIATLALLSQAQQYLDCRVMLTTRVAVKPAGITKIWIKANINLRPLVTIQDAYKKVLEISDETYGYTNLEINRKVSVSDITNTWKKLPEIDDIEIIEIKILPYVRPLENTLLPLNITFPTLPKTTVKLTYLLIYRSVTNKFEIYRDTYQIGEVALNTVYVDGTFISFSIAPGTYNNNDKWEFILMPTYPDIFPVSSIQVSDFSAPIIEVSPFISDSIPRVIFSELNFIPQGTGSACLPPCN